MSSNLPNPTTNGSMDRQTADRLVAMLVIVILAIGGYGTLRAYWRLRTTSGMMGDMMRTMPGTDPIWYMFGTLIAVSAVLGTYAIIRDTVTIDSATTADTEISRKEETDAGQNQVAKNAEQDSVTQHSSTPRLLDMLPEDEQRLLEPILESPGLTQVELRGRSGFSKAKVSQTISELENRGLLYREKQGRTYRVYPGELLKNH